MAPEQLITLTYDAFQDVPCPTSWIAPGEYPGETQCGLLQGRLRESVTNDDLFAAIGNSNLHVLSPEAMAYYWPRFVQAAVEGQGDEVWESFATHMLFVLSHADDPYTRSQFRLFTGQERQAVVRFLEFMAELEWVQRDVPQLLQRAQQAWQER